MVATVTKSTGSRYFLRLGNGTLVSARMKGKLRLKGMKTTNPVAVGDHVEVVCEQDNEWLITALIPRKNYIVRKSINLSKQLHIVAANIDQALLLITLKMPATPPGFIDRFLLTAAAWHVPVILVFNKMDIYTPAEFQEVNQFMDIYKKIGYTCLPFNSVSGEKEPLFTLLKDKTTLVAGHSGVGKSTFINHLQPQLKLKTDSVSEYHLKGQHTTTFAEMFELDVGGFIIDTPGIKGFGIVDVDRKELSHYFLDMRSVLSRCRFHNCQHIEEPGCAVKNAVAEGSIAPHRYKNYLDVYFNREADEQEQYK